MGGNGLKKSCHLFITCQSVSNDDWRLLWILILMIILKAYSLMLNKGRSQNFLNLIFLLHISVDLL